MKNVGAIPVTCISIRKKHLEKMAQWAILCECRLSTDIIWQDQGIKRYLMDEFLHYCQTVFTSSFNLEWSTLLKFFCVYLAKSQLLSLNITNPKCVSNTSYYCGLVLKIIKFTYYNFLGKKGYHTLQMIITMCWQLKVKSK